MIIQHLCATLLLTLSNTASAQNNLYPASKTEYGHAFAGSMILDPQAPGGFGTSSNLPRENANALDFREGDLYLHVDTEGELRFHERYAANTVYLVNQSGLSYDFPAADSRLHLFAEIFHTGEWIAVERMPTLFCGNSYHRLTLGANQYWVFALPKYDGRDAVKMRYRVTRVFGEGENDTAYAEIISAEFDAFYPLENLGVNSE